MKALPLSYFLQDIRQFKVDDDFDNYLSGGKWTSTIANSGTVTAGDVAGGRLAIVSSGGSPALNDETYVKTTKQPFLLATSKPALWETRIQFTEANTNKANIICGFM